MKVYCVLSSVPYEGNTLEYVYQNLDDAKNFLKIRVNNYNYEFTSETTIEDPHGYELIIQTMDVL